MNNFFRKLKKEETVFKNDTKDIFFVEINSHSKYMATITKKGQNIHLTHETQEYLCPQTVVEENNFDIYDSIVCFGKIKLEKNTILQPIFVNTLHQ